LQSVDALGHSHLTWEWNCQYENPEIECVSFRVRLVPLTGTSPKIVYHQNYLAIALPLVTELRENHAQSNLHHIHWWMCTAKTVPTDWRVSPPLHTNAAPHEHSPSLHLYMWFRSV